MIAALRQFARGVAGTVFPPVCVHCGGVVRAGPLRHVCPPCAGLIHRVRAPHCAVCGHPFFGAVEGERLCPHCETLHPAYREGRTFTLLKGPARALVHELKYHRGQHVLVDLETLVRESAETLDFIRGAALVPVPLHPRKRRSRGYNQAQLLAEALARAAGGGTRVEEPLRRVLHLDSQTHLDRKKRQENLKNAFALAPGFTLDTQQHYILIDDVFTTGSTLNACARILRRAGCRKLDVVTFGHG